MDQIRRRRSVTENDARHDHPLIRRCLFRSDVGSVVGSDNRSVVEGKDLGEELVEGHEDAANLDQNVLTVIAMAGGILEDDVSIFWKIETTVVGLDWL